MIHKNTQESLADYLSTKVFHAEEGQVVAPGSVEVDGFALFMERYTEGLAIERAAVDHFVENWKK